MSQLPSNYTEGGRSSHSFGALFFIPYSKRVHFIAQRSLSTHIEKPAQFCVALLSQTRISFAIAGLAYADIQTDISYELVRIDELLGGKAGCDSCRGDRADAGYFSKFGCHGKVRLLLDKGCDLLVQRLELFGKRFNGRVQRRLSLRKRTRLQLQAGERTGETPARGEQLIQLVHVFALETVRQQDRKSV